MKIVPFPHLRTNIHSLAVIVDDAVADRQAEPGAVRLRGEERIEDLRQYLGGMPEPVAGGESRWRSSTPR